MKTTALHSNNNHHEGDDGYSMFSGIQLVTTGGLSQMIDITKNKYLIRDNTTEDNNKGVDIHIGTEGGL